LISFAKLDKNQRNLPQKFGISETTKSETKGVNFVENESHLEYRPGSNVVRSFPEMLITEESYG
jgi:hypothetical protein